MARPHADVVASLRETSLFGLLGESVLREIEGDFELVDVPGGYTLMREGEVEECLYVLLHGRLRAFVVSGAGEQFVGEIGRGESVGEMAILTGAPRSATVRAARDSQLLRLTKVGFERLLGRAPVVALELARMVVNRLHQTMHAAPRPRAPATIAVVPSKKDVGHSDLARSLAASLATMGRAIHLDKARVDEALGANAAQAEVHDGSARLVGWLTELEGSHDFVVYEADETLSGWTRRCVRQADRVLIVARAGSNPDMGEIENEFWTGDTVSRPAAELVLIREPDRGEPRSAAGWLAPPRRFTMHHHVRRGAARDVARLARLVACRAVGLVLGGGGARAFAHIGVVRALREAGIPVDIVGGCSMGAVMAAQVAAEWDVETMVERTRTAFLRSGSLFDYTVPIMALIGGRRFVRVLTTMFGSTRVEDLPLKYFCVSTNLTRAVRVVHESGPLVKWLCSTISVPGLAPPVFHEGDLLVDGSLLDTVPADVLRGYGRGDVIAVDVTAPVDLAVDERFLDNPTTWQVVWNRVNPFARRRLPTMYRIILRSTMLSSEVERIRVEADVYIRPPVEGVDLLDWKALERIVDLGYRAASEQLTGSRYGAPGASHRA